MDSWAKFSSDRTYRYLLARTWDSGRILNVIGLNPSTADEIQDDPTIRRCLGYARDWGYGTLLMTNLYAFRATDPKTLTKAHIEPIGDNDHWLEKVACQSDLVLAAWGTHKMAIQRYHDILELLPKPIYCLGLTKEGHPRHPLYMPKDAEPIIWRS